MRLPELADALRRHFDLAPGAIDIAGLASTIVLTKSIESLEEVQAARLYCLRTAVAAVAAEYQAISLWLPPTATGLDVEILGVHLHSPAIDQFYFGVGTSTTYSDRGAGYNLDLRDFGAGYRSAAHLVDESDAAPLLTAQGQLNCITTGLGAQAVWFPRGMFLRPGYLWTFRTPGLNQGISGMIVWRETPRSQLP